MTQAHNIPKRLQNAAQNDKQVEIHRKRDKKDNRNRATAHHLKTIQVTMMEMTKDHQAVTTITQLDQENEQTAYSNRDYGYVKAKLCKMQLTTRSIRHTYWITPYKDDPYEEYATLNDTTNCADQCQHYMRQKPIWLQATLDWITHHCDDTYRAYNGDDQEDAYTEMHAHLHMILSSRCPKSMYNNKHKTITGHRNSYKKQIQK